MTDNTIIENELIEALRRIGPTEADVLLSDISDTDAGAAAVERLLASGRLLLTRKKKLALPEQTGLLYGRVQGNARGFGFFIPADGSKDLFLSAECMHGAMHGDMVWVREASGRSGDGAEVVLIAVRAQHRVIGVYESNAQGGYVTPDDTKLSMDVLVFQGDELGAKTGDKVVVTLTQYPDGRRALTGRVTEILGGKSEKGTDILSIIRRLDLPDDFSKSAMQQARRLNKPVSGDEMLRREDLRTCLTITIDGADAKDLDDAVSLVAMECGSYMLGVHIADVSAYVEEDSPLDKEARKRGSSVYLPDCVLPMFPKPISNGVCSLNEGEAKRTLSCFMEYTQDGKQTAHRVAETVIQTAHRMSYEDVNAMYAGDVALQEKYADIWPMLQDMRLLAETLHAKRVKRGAIDFDLDEAKIELDKRGKPVEVRVCERGIANRMIEEFMLAANETVATHITELGFPMLYRVHEPPDKDRLQALNTFLNTLGYGIKNIGNVKPVTLQKVLERVKGTKEENVVSRVTLRSLQRARYCESNLGHFGLALECYCHFTSPIRRYPDLTVHRLLKDILHARMDEKRAEAWRAALPALAEQTSERERVATEAERAADDLKKAEYMQGRIGAIETGIIAGVTQYGFFVELPNTVQGLVRIASLEDDYYTCDDKNYRIVGRASKRIFRLGDEVRVRVLGVDLDNANIDFALERGTRGPKKPGDKKPTEKKQTDKKPDDNKKTDIKPTDAKQTEAKPSAPHRRGGRRSHAKPSGA